MTSKEPPENLYVNFIVFSFNQDVNLFKLTKYREEANKTKWFLDPKEAVSVNDHPTSQTFVTGAQLLLLEAWVLWAPSGSGVGHAAGRVYTASSWGWGPVLVDGVPLQFSLNLGGGRISVGVFFSWAGLIFRAPRDDFFMCRRSNLFSRF